MSQEYMQITGNLVTARVLTLAMAWGIVVPKNPPEIVTVHDSGFRVDTNQMAEYTPYLVEFMKSQYLIWKRKDGALMVVDIE